METKTRNVIVIAGSFICFLVIAGSAVINQRKIAKQYEAFLKGLDYDLNE